MLKLLLCNIKVNTTVIVVNILLTDSGYAKLRYVSEDRDDDETVNGEH